MKILESGEDYLERILILQEKLGNVRSIDLANDMHFSKPSVSVAIHKLEEGGYLTIDANGYLHLTKKGNEVASKIYERHVLLTKLFVSIGVDEETASKDACKIEHDLSEKTIEALKKLNK